MLKAKLIIISSLIALLGAPVPIFSPTGHGEFDCPADLGYFFSKWSPYNPESNLHELDHEWVRLYHNVLPILENGRFPTFDMFFNLYHQQTSTTKVIQFLACLLMHQDKFLRHSSLTTYPGQTQSFIPPIKQPIRLQPIVHPQPAYPIYRWQPPPPNTVGYQSSWPPVTGGYPAPIVYMPLGRGYIPYSDIERQEISEHHSHIEDREKYPQPPQTVERGSGIPHQEIYPPVTYDNPSIATYPGTSQNIREPSAPPFEDPYNYPQESQYKSRDQAHHIRPQPTAPQEYEDEPTFIPRSQKHEKSSSSTINPAKESDSGDDTGEDINKLFEA